MEISNEIQELYKTVLKNNKKIYKWCLDITMNTKTDIFLNFYGHINQVEIQIYHNGWNAKGEFTKCSYDFGTYKLDSEKNMEATIYTQNGIIETLKRTKKHSEKSYLGKELNFK